MSPLLSRILLTIVLFPLAGVVNFLLAIAADDFVEGIAEMVVSTALTAMFMIAFWVLVWRKTVRWTRRRIRMSFIMAAVAAAISAAIAIGMALGVEYFDEDAAIYVGIMLGALLWMAATTFIWRESAAERAERLSRGGEKPLACPACSYDMKGLREARCPECGAQYTIDELFASQAGAVAAEIERA